MTPDILGEEPNTHRSFDARKPNYRAKLEDYERYTKVAQLWLELELNSDRNGNEDEWHRQHAGRIKKFEARIGFFDPAELDEIWRVENSKKNCTNNSLGRQILRP